MVMKMNKFKGTPGPWEMKPEEVDKHYIRIRGTQLGWRYKVANVLTPFYEGVHEREAKETRANAQLIAASPELLEALQIICFFEDISSAQREIAEAAIAKALGESQ